MARAPLVRPARALGIDVGATKVRAGIVDARGHLVRRSDRVPLDGRSPGDVLQAIDQALASVGPASVYERLPAGIAIAAQIDLETGVVWHAPNLGWSRVPIGRRLARRLGHRVTVENDVRAAALAEWKFGAGRGIDDLVLLWIGTGVGGGVVADGRLLRGHAAAAGELGHLTVVAGGRRCHCPHRGCLEAYVGGWAIEERAAEAARAHARSRSGAAPAGRAQPRATARDVFALARTGDPIARRLLTETEEFLIAGAVTIANAFNPRYLILGGPIPSDWPGISGRVERAVRRSAQPPAARLRVVPARLGDWAPVIGAALGAADAEARRRSDR